MRQETNKSDKKRKGTERSEGKRTQKKEGMRHLLREPNFVRILRDFWGGGSRNQTP